MQTVDEPGSADEREKIGFYTPVESNMVVLSLRTKVNG